MRRSFGNRDFRLVIATAAEETCELCGGPLHVTQHRERFVERLDGLVQLVRRDKRCGDETCRGRAKVFRPLEDLRFALPRMNFGTDVVVAVGERHLERHESLGLIVRDLTEGGVPMGQTSAGRLLRCYLALADLARGDDETVRKRLRARGGIVPMLDGVQFDEHSPVIYLVWDALSGEPLFGERRAFRSADDLKSLLLRVKEMEVPVIGIVSDKEKGLVPAVTEVFPDAPYQFCQTHFLKNCAKPLADDLSALQESVEDRAEKARKIAKRLHDIELRDQKATTREEETAANDVQAETSAGKTDEAETVTAPEAEPISERELVTEEAAAANHEQAETPTKADDAETVTVPEARKADAPPVPPEAEAISERELVAELCAITRENARSSGKAPLQPPALARHNRLETIRQAVDLARSKAREGGALKTSQTWPYLFLTSSRTR
jgi:hypothetical protein